MRDMPTNEIFGVVHVDDSGKPLCRQDGYYFKLVPKKAFLEIPGINQCRRCQRSLGISALDHQISWLSEKQEKLLIAIHQKTGGVATGNWCPATDLITEKTDSAWTSLHRSLRRLVVKNLIEKRVNPQNRVLVRLAIQCVNPAPSGKLIVYWDSSAPRKARKKSLKSKRKKST